MKIANWLDKLPQFDSRFITGDLDSIASRKYPFLSDDQVRNQISRLSGHLGSMEEKVRRLAISYSLYNRQLDIVQECLSKEICHLHCERPPIGCCNANHFVIFSMSDLILSRPSPIALHLSEIILRMQKNEDAYYLQDGREKTAGYCSLLTSQGCTLRLFKSPVCVHYLCSGIASRLHKQFGVDACSFTGEMIKMSLQTIESSYDFTSQDVIAAALPLFTRLDWDK
jgi:hypothetical protein